MLYNGFVQYASRLLFIVYIVKVFLFCITYLTQQQYAKLWFNDSLVLLYLLSSGVLTIWLLFFLYHKLHTSHIKIKHYGVYIAIFFVLNYFVYSGFINVYVSIALKIHSLNTNLQNGLLNIHPPLIYYIYSAVLFMYIALFSHKSTINTIWNSGYFTYHYIIICGVGILLGAWWAAQELNWGGFWSWDPVETVSLIIFFYLVVIFHFRARIYTRPKNLINLFIIALLVYSVIRMGVLNTIHSFITSPNSVWYVVFALLGTIFMISLNILYSLLTYMTVSKHIGESPIHKLLSLLQMLLNLCIISLFYLICQQWLGFLQLPTFRLYFLVILIVISYLYLSVLQNKHIHTIATFLLISLIATYTTGAQSLLCAFCMYSIIYGLFKYDYKNIHVSIFVTYILFHIIFINIPVYTTTIHPLFYYVAENFISENKGWGSYYESGFFMRKKIMLLLHKGVYSHISGFTIVSDFFESYYIFRKNDVLYHLFCEENLFLFFGMLLVGSVIYMYYTNHPLQVAKFQNY